MVRFYNLTPDQVRELSAATAGQMWLAITRLEAEEMLRELVVVNSVNLEKDKKKRLIADLENKIKKTGPSQKSPEVSNEELDKFLRGVLSGRG